MGSISNCILEPKYIDLSLSNNFTDFKVTKFIYDCVNPRLYEDDYIVIDGVNHLWGEETNLTYIEEYIEKINSFIDDPEIIFSIINNFIEVQTNKSIELSSNFQTLLGFNEIILSNKRASIPYQLAITHKMFLYLLPSNHKSSRYELNTAGIVMLPPYINNHSIKKEADFGYRKIKWNQQIKIIITDEKDNVMRLKKDWQMFIQFDL